MNTYKTEDEKLLIKGLISAIINFFFCAAFFFIMYDIVSAYGEFATKRKVIDVVCMIVIFIAAFVSHFAVYKKEPRFEKKGYKIVYWVVTILFMNPYMFYSMIYIIG